mmetsp:Transcript_6191/g.16513  ORF Transcript_6191/g.16513 Transcript_6191/m.16513 type:complete len:246 (-) Transcript_6191:268-1005(-)
MLSDSLKSGFSGPGALGTGGESLLSGRVMVGAAGVTLGVAVAGAVGESVATAGGTASSEGSAVGAASDCDGCGAAVLGGSSLGSAEETTGGGDSKSPMSVSLGAGVAAVEGSSVSSGSGAIGGAAEGIGAKSDGSSIGGEGSVGPEGSDSGISVVVSSFSTSSGPSCLIAEYSKDESARCDSCAATDASTAHNTRRTSGARARTRDHTRGPFLHSARFPHRQKIAACAPHCSLIARALPNLFPSN